MLMASSKKVRHAALCPCRGGYNVAVVAPPGVAGPVVVLVPALEGLVHTLVVVVCVLGIGADGLPVFLQFLFMLFTPILGCHGVS